MRSARSHVALVAAGAMLVSARSHAQPNLPPPPPPPIERSPSPPSLPPPPPPPPSREPPPSQPRPAPSRRATPAPPPAPPPYVAPRPARETAYVFEEQPARSLAVTFNPLPLFWGRISANVEVLLAPHHAVVGSANLLLSNVNRGGVLAEAFGFAQKSSSGFGVEVGYHYWWYWHRSLQGPFFGPSLLLGTTTNATVGGVPDAQTYWGIAVDAGEQAVLAGGFTLGAGVGLGLVRMGNAGAVFPRFLLQLGWAF